MPWAARLVIQVHLESCRDCQCLVSALEEQEAKFIDVIPEAPMRPGALGELIAKLRRTPVTKVVPVTVGDVVLPRALSGIRVSRRRWFRSGVWLARLPQARRGGWGAYILRVPPGQVLPSPRRLGGLLVCVLSGAFVERQRYSAGDFAEYRRAPSHGFTATPEAPCACLISIKRSRHSSEMSRLPDEWLSA